jgi:PKHD-type hydroxylase
MLTIADVLTPEDVERVREGLGSAPFGDGKRTASGPAKTVKANAQTDGSDARVQALAKFVRDALERHPVFSLYARPARWSPLLFNRYRGGDAYGFHVDNPVMGEVRTDLSFTVFLTDPDNYEGGALLVDGLDGEREVKLSAGSVVLYPTGALHRVTPVTSGERLAAVGWIQSLIRRADEREILFDLGRTRASLPDSEPRLILDKAIGNLVRLWGEP